MESRGVTYPPLNRLKPVTDNVRVVDGPAIRFDIPWLKLPFSTRMTLIRLREGALFVHSPTPLSPELEREVKAVGIPRWIISPNRLHYWWIPEWRAAFPGADVYLRSRLESETCAARHRSRRMQCRDSRSWQLPHRIALHRPRKDAAVHRAALDHPDNGLPDPARMSKRMPAPLHTLRARSFHTHDPGLRGS